jgi:hypothetical protein
MSLLPARTRLSVRRVLNDRGCSLRKWWRLPRQQILSDCEGRH